MKLFETLKTLGSAEEFFQHLGVEYDPAVVKVKRLHILQRFHQYLRAETGLAGLEEAQAHECCRALLTRAYGDVLTADGRTLQVFKVFRDAAGLRTVSLDSLRARRAG